MKILATTLHVPLVLLVWIGWLMVDWQGSEPRSILIAAGIALVIAAANWLLARRVLFIAAPVAVAAALVAFTFVDVSPVQGAARAVRKIHPGMSESAVRGILAAEFPARFRPQNMNAPMRENTISFILGTDGRYNAAIVQVVFANGRVVNAEFLPD